MFRGHFSEIQPTGENEREPFGLLPFPSPRRRTVFGGESLIGSPTMSNAVSHDDRLGLQPAFLRKRAGESVVPSFSALTGERRSFRRT